MQFRDRTEAGRRLADLVVRLGLDDPLVFALPRGGVVVAAPVAERLGVGLDVLVSRKVGAPQHPELAIGAVAEGGGVVVDRDLLASLALSEADFEKLVAGQRLELARRVERYRGEPLPDVAGRTVVLVDDGVATGATAEAAIEALQRLDVGRLVLAVPVCAPDSAARLESLVDDFVCVVSPAPFAAVGQWYDDFAQVTDDQVLELLR